MSLSPSSNESAARFGENTAFLAGADLIIGGPGADVIEAGQGDDRVRADELDEVSGGKGFDRCLDAPALSDCERERW